MQCNLMNFVVSRKLASNQGVDDKEASRLGIVGSIIGDGLVGPVVARTLASRAAPPPAPPRLAPLPGTGNQTGTPGNGGGDLGRYTTEISSAFTTIREVRRSIQDIVKNRENLAEQEGEQREAVKEIALKLCTSVQELVKDLVESTDELKDCLDQPQLEELKKQLGECLDPSSSVSQGAASATMTSSPAEQKRSSRSK